MNFSRIILLHPNSGFSWNLKKLSCWVFKTLWDLSKCWVAQTTLIDRHVHSLNQLNEKTALSACEYFEGLRRLQTFRTKSTFFKLPFYSNRFKSSENQELKWSLLFSRISKSRFNLKLEQISRNEKIRKTRFFPSWLIFIFCFYFVFFYLIWNHLQDHTHMTEDMFISSHQKKIHTRSTFPNLNSVFRLAAKICTLEN